MKIAGLGGDNHFLKADSKARWYYPILDNERLGGKYTLVLGGSLGYGVSFQERFNGKENLPLSDRYFPGGLSTVRGFKDRSLGPREEGDVVGGDKQAIMNVELQFPLLEKYSLKGVAFFDQGQAFSESETIDPGEFRRSVGIGARWLSPFGPLRLELGFPLNKEPDDDTSVVGFSVGAQ
jgi:outer membrane protein insertion porin family